jgi:hypothetical protein
VFTRLKNSLSVRKEEIIMTDTNNVQAGYQSSQPNPALKKLDRLIGTWEVPGGAQRKVTYEWMEGGFFLIQHGDLNDNKGMEIIGYGRRWEGVESPDCVSHYFDNKGNLFTYGYDMEDDTLTIWGGQRGSPAYYKGTFSKDGDTLTGSWVYPGGGYESTSTRVE